jgi:hypothetical protein
MKQELLILQELLGLPPGHELLKDKQFLLLIRHSPCYLYMEQDGSLQKPGGKPRSS